MDWTLTHDLLTTVETKEGPKTVNTQAFKQFLNPEWEGTEPGAFFWHSLHLQCQYQYRIACVLADCMASAITVAFSSAFLTIILFRMLQEAASLWATSRSS